MRVCNFVSAIAGLGLGWMIVANWASAEDWPMGGRSAARNPVTQETGAPTDWRLPTADNKPQNVKWVTHVGYHSLGGPVVAGGFVWVGTQPGLDAEGGDCALLVCVRESDGKIVYQYRSPRLEGALDWPRQGLSGSPLVEGDRIWFITNRREVICLDCGPLRTGTGMPRVVWTVDMVRQFKIHPRGMHTPTWDMYGSPVAYGEFLYIPTGNNIAERITDPIPSPDAPSLVCLRKDTGALVWSDNSPGRNLMLGNTGSPAIAEVGGRALVIHPQGDGWVRAFDHKTGGLIWKFDLNRKNAKGFWDDGIDRENRRVIAAAPPVIEGGRVYISTGWEAETGEGPGRVFCLDPTRTGDVSAELPAGQAKGKPNANSAVVWEFTGEKLPRNERMYLSHSTVAVYNSLLIAADGNGIVHCLDKATGKQHWSHNTNNEILGNLLIADGKIFVGNGDGDIFIFNARSSKSVIATHHVDHSVASQIVYANKSLFILNQSELISIQSQ